MAHAKTMLIANADWLDRFDICVRIVETIGWLGWIHPVTHQRTQISALVNVFSW